MDVVGGFPRYGSKKIDARYAPFGHPSGFFTARKSIYSVADHINKVVEKKSIRVEVTK